MSKMEWNEEGHILIVHPSGAVGLYACMGTFTIEDNNNVDG